MINDLLANTDPTTIWALVGIAVTIVVSIGIFAFMLTKKAFNRTD